MIKKIFCYFIVLIISTFTITTALAEVSAEFSWLPNSESNLAGYVVYYGTQSRNYDFSHDVGNPPLSDGRVHVNITGLQNDTLYYFTVVAYDTDGIESNYSWELTYLTPSLDTATSFPSWNVYLDNDGIRDTVYINESGVYVIYGSASITSSPQLLTSYFTLGNWSPKKNILDLVDVNGDGVLDFYGIGDYGVRVAYGIDGRSLFT